MIAALGNPRPFDEPARETELYLAGERINRCKPLRPQPPLHGVLVAAEQESKLAYSVAERFPADTLAEAQRLRRARVAFRKSHWVHGADFDRALASESHAEHAGHSPAQWARARRHLRSGDEVYARSLLLQQQSSASDSGGGGGGGGGGSGSSSGQRGSGAGVGRGGSGDLALLLRQKQGQQRPGTTGQAVGGRRGGSSRGSGSAMPRSSQGARVAAPTRAASPPSASSASSASGGSKHSSPRNVWQFQTSYGAGVGALHAPGSSAIVPTFAVRSSKSSRGTL